MILSRTPLRISFAGGGSDLSVYYRFGYGAVVSTAINKYMYVAVNRTFDPNIRIIYSKVEYVKTIDEIEHNLAREALKLVGINGGGLDIAYMGDMLPAHTGSGLGASSALTVGILNALYALKGESVSAERLAAEASHIEIEILGRPIGKQDQYASACGGLNYIRFNKDETVNVVPLNCGDSSIDELNKNLLLFYTGLKAQSDTILTEQRAKTQENKTVFDEMVSMADSLRDSVKAGDINSFGKTLHLGWINKQKIASNITNNVIDGYYEAARKAGAAGGKILGSGGGGFLLLYCGLSAQESVRKALADLPEVPFGFEPEGSKIIYNSGE